MLSKLTIKNFALIDSLELDFRPGLSVITGETGAGKSIMLGALSLLLGTRAVSGSNSNPGEKTIVEAIFENVEVPLPEVASEGESESDEVIVRREISSSGRSRAFINDTPVNLKTLGEFTSRLIDIHSQHNNLLIADTHYQLDVVDAFIANRSQLAAYRDCFKQYLAVRNRLNGLRAAVEKGRQRNEVIEMQLEQLNKLKPKRGELPELERQFDLLSEAGEISEALSQASSRLNLFEGSVLSGIKEVRDSLRKARLSLLEDETEGPTLGERLEASFVELKDIAETLEQLASKVEADPAKLAHVEERMTDLYQACKRFNVNDDSELCDLYESLRHQAGSAGEAEIEIPRLEKELKELGTRLRHAADTLTQSRLEGAQALSKELVSTAMPLGMANLNFQIQVEKGRLTSEGQDAVRFLCSFNKRQELMELQKVASGGEISRLMLCLKSIMAGKMNLPTIIFDEVDTGVSGEIAARMGEMMKRMGEEMQVLTITHLPQVAAQGRYHYKVYKTDIADRTVSSVCELDEEGRREELASMLSGTEVSEAALRNAETLLGLKKE